MARRNKSDAVEVVIVKGQGQFTLYYGVFSMSFEMKPATMRAFVALVEAVKADEDSDGSITLTGDDGRHERTVQVYVSRSGGPSDCDDGDREAEYMLGICFDAGDSVFWLDWDGQIS